MSGLRRLKSILPVVTAQCNLSCSYCYQLAKKPGRMAWSTLKMSLDWALEMAGPHLNVVFLGGEPLLEFPLIRRAVNYISERCRADCGVRYSITTNGILMEESIARFLEQHRFDTQLSMDGIAAAQDLRSRGTFASLNRLLGRLREQRPRLFHEDLTISITLIPPAIPFLADSVRYLIDEDCRKIAISPLITPHPAWTDACVGQLEKQFASLRDLSADHFRRTNRIPVLLFRGEEREAELRFRRGSMCGVMRGTTPAVDIDGQVYGCALLAGSGQAFTPPLLRRLHEVMKIGAIGDPRLGERFREYLEATSREETLNRKADKYTSFGRCGDCPHFEDCSICPVSIAHIPGNRDPARAPDFACAFTRIALRHRRLFLRQARRAADTDLDLILLRFQELAGDNRARRRPNYRAGP
jgi:sulfatase maturation enzyme AslB (radical SAM superfamily)